MNVAADPDASPWQTWSAAERESFFTAIARHRRAAWRVTAACAVGYVLLSAIVALLLAPLLWCVAGLLVDVFNLAVPMPDLLGALGRFVDPLLEDAPVPMGRIAQILCVAAAPGLVAMLMLSFALSRVLSTSPLFAGEGLGGRAPATHALAEQRLKNVAEEMALAAGTRPPRVMIVPGGVNAAVTGIDASATVLVGERLLESLDRSQMQGVLAHLVGSLADGDLTIGRRTATTRALFAIIARFSGGLADPDTFRRALSLWRVFFRPTAPNTTALLQALADPFDDAALPREDGSGDAAAKPASRSATRTDAGNTPNTLTWRQWAAMPLAGPLIITGFFGGLVSQFLLGPLVSLAWRERKYMADATAVRLTRDPDALAGALVKMAHAPVGLPGWAMHLAVAGSGPSKGGLFGGTIVDIFPSLERRGRALVKMGARVMPASSERGLHGPALVLVIALFSIVGVLMCVAAGLLVWISLALSMLFTGLPAAALHALLRWIGH